MGTNKAMIFVHRHPVHTSTECHKVYTDYGNGYITCTECHICYPNWALGTSVVPNALSIMNDIATSTTVQLLAASMIFCLIFSFLMSSVSGKCQWVKYHTTFAPEWFWLPSYLNQTASHSQIRSWYNWNESENLNQRAYSTGCWSIKMTPIWMN